MPACGRSSRLVRLPRSRLSGNRARSEREAASSMVRGELNGGLEDQEGALMSTEVISQPSISHRGRRRVLLAAARDGGGGRCRRRSDGRPVVRWDVRRTRGRRASAVVVPPPTPRVRRRGGVSGGRGRDDARDRPFGSHRRVVASDASARGQGDCQPGRDRRPGLFNSGSRTARRCPTVRRSPGCSPRSPLRMPAPS